MPVKSPGSGWFPLPLMSRFNWSRAGGDAGSSLARQGVSALFQHAASPVLLAESRWLKLLGACPPLTSFGGNALYILQKICSSLPPCRTCLLKPFSSISSSYLQEIPCVGVSETNDHRKTTGGEMKDLDVHTNPQTTTDSLSPEKRTDSSEFCFRSRC